MIQIRRDALALWTGLLALGLASAAGADGVIGQVTAVTGEATAQQPDEEPRQLACGDPIYESDRLATSEASGLGVTMGDVFTHLSEETAVQMELTPEKTADATLEVGKVRMIDAREGGPAARLGVLDARAQIASTDTEGYLFKEKVGPYAMLCEWDEPLDVQRADERAVASPGNCVIAKKSEPLYTAEAHQKRLPAFAEVCEIDPALLAQLAGNPDHHLSPADVAAPGPGNTTAGLGDMAPGIGANPARTSCDAGCGVPTPAAVVAPSPGTGGVSLF